MKDWTNIQIARVISYVSLIPGIVSLVVTAMLSLGLFKVSALYMLIPTFFIIVGIITLNRIGHTSGSWDDHKPFLDLIK